MSDISHTPSWILLAAIAVTVVLWYLYRRPSSKYTNKRHLSSEYFTGLNYLLNDEQGKALDIFVKLVESDWEIIDTHFALGKIFRKNGETDKAIKIHQGLIARPSLPEKYRSQVLLELGYDYLGAGWFDRAEGLFKEVLLHEPDSEVARKNLIIIYQQEKDWHKAIDVAVNLYDHNSSEIGPMISQYYCELAELAKAKGDTAQMQLNAKKALSYDAGSVRASILLAEQSIEDGKYNEAIQLFKQIEKQDVEFIPVVLNQLIECYHKLDRRDELLGYMDELENKCKTPVFFEKHAAVIEKYRGQEAVTEYLMGRLKISPSLQGIHYLLEYSRNDAARNSELMQYLQVAVKHMQQDEVDFQCHHCGFQSNTLYWLCPSCQSWGQVKPVSLEAI